MNKEIFIFGGSGIVGDYLCKNLNLKNVFPLNSSHCDLTSIEEINTFFSNYKKPSIIIFLVGLAHKKGKKRDYDEFDRINYVALKNIISFYHENNIMPDKIIFSSTISVYGESLSITDYNENVSPKPKSPYAQTKLKAEKYLQKNFPEKTWILRLSPVYSSTFLLNIIRRTKVSYYIFFW